jgi:hypothetical protein
MTINRMFIVFIVLGALVTAAAQTVQVSNCNTNSVFTITDLSVDPIVPVKGQNITVHTIYTVPADVVSGVATYKISFNGIPFSPTVDDLCTQTPCPILAGLHDEYSSVLVPDISGKVIADMIWSDEASSTTYLCLRTTLKI